jgi:hypothetical protein
VQYRNNLKQNIARIKGTGYPQNSVGSSKKREEKHGTNSAQKNENFYENISNQQGANCIISPYFEAIVIHLRTHTIRLQLYYWYLKFS